MNRMSILAGLFLTANLAVADIGLPRGRHLPGKQPLPPNDLRGVPTIVAAVPPHPSKAAVVELLEDDAAWLARQLNRNMAQSERDKLGRADPWGEDCYSGGACLKVAGIQRFTEQVPGWGYPVVEKPAPGEYRFIRFAWKKPETLGLRFAWQRPEDTGIMVQLCVSGIDWHRYYAGTNKVGYAPAFQVGANPPREWEVVTRDLYADYKAPHTMTGFAFTSMEGVALFDHVYLGRTIEDLDRVTNAAKIGLRKDRLTDDELAANFKNLSSEDASLRNPAIWAMSRDAEGCLRHLKTNVKIPDPAEITRQIRRLIADLDSPRFAVRELAVKKLDELGLAAMPHLQEAIRQPNPSPELVERAVKLVEKHKLTEPTLSNPATRTLLSAMHILEQAETPEARALLEHMGKAINEPVGASENAAALERLAKRIKKQTRED
ncbi:hypothetical protein [Zavarzinella formosa]|uniref:hypothetical protein n=1 Tax=Zavarzinella formosa TaxID=360055 RepID=UPI000300AF5B|nr:hypothetical protein [Zavarzinella formosa]